MVFFVWISMTDGGLGLGLGFYWEDMAVIARGLGYGTSAICVLGVDRNKTIDLQAYMCSKTRVCF